MHYTSDSKYSAYVQWLEQLEMKKAVASELTKTTALHLPSVKLTIDNATMIGAAGYLRAMKKEFTKPENLKAQGNLGL